jgi:hypothetical protein
MISGQRRQVYVFLLYNTHHSRHQVYKPEEDVAKDSNTVSDGMNMFILPSDIKKERESPDNSFNESNEEIYKSENCQNSYLDDIAAQRRQVYVFLLYNTHHSRHQVYKCSHFVTCHPSVLHSLV